LHYAILNEGNGTNVSKFCLAMAGRLERKPPGATTIPFLAPFFANLGNGRYDSNFLYDSVSFRHLLIGLPSFADRVLHCLSDSTGGRPKLPPVSSEKNTESNQRQCFLQSVRFRPLTSFLRCPFREPVTGREQKTGDTLKTRGREN